MLFGSYVVRASLFESVDLRLHQAIDDVHFGVNLPDFELFLSYELPDVMKPYLNVFLLRMVDWISDEVYCALGVAIDGR